MFAGEGVEESPGMAHAAGFDEESVGLGAAENLGDGDGERGGDGAAETSAGDLTNHHAAVSAGGGGGAVGTRDDPAGCVEHGPVDAERTELVHHDGPALVGGALRQEVAYRRGLTHPERARDDVHGDRHHASRRPRPCPVYWDLPVVATRQSNLGGVEDLPSDVILARAQPGGGGGGGGPWRPGARHAPTPRRMVRLRR